MSTFDFSFGINAADNNNIGQNTAPSVLRKEDHYFMCNVVTSGKKFSLSSGNKIHCRL